MQAGFIKTCPALSLLSIPINNGGKMKKPDSKVWLTKIRNRGLRPGPLRLDLLDNIMGFDGERLGSRWANKVNIALGER